VSFRNTPYKYRAQRLAKFQQSRCPACVAKLVEEQRQAAPLPKVQALKQLPPGTQVSLSIRADGAWTGTLTVGGETYQTVGENGAGPQAVVGTLAQLWLSAHEAE